MFPTEQGEPFSRHHLTFVVRGRIEAANLGKDGACHLFRHTMATLMHENGADIRHIQVILDHEDIKTTQIAIRTLQQVHAATHPAEAGNVTQARARQPSGRICWRRWKPRKRTTKSRAAQEKNENEGIIVSMATFHISEADAARDFPGLMARVRAGAEIIIESDARAVAIVRPAGDEFRPRLLSESIALAKKHAEELGYEPRMDPEFAADLEEIIKSRRPWNPPAWE